MFTVALTVTGTCLVRIVRPCHGSCSDRDRWGWRWRVHPVLWFAVGGILGMMWALLLVGPLIDAVKKRRR